MFVLGAERKRLGRRMWDERPLSFRPWKVFPSESSRRIPPGDV